MKPVSNTLTYVLIIVLVLVTTAGAARLTMHPGAVNQIDSASYDALLIAEAAIDQARREYQAKRLPDSAKGPLDTLIQSYNLARESWLTYRGAIATKVTPGLYLAQLTNNIAALTQAIRGFRKEGECT